jgi:hypothetical protein
MNLFSSITSHVTGSTLLVFALVTSPVAAQVAGLTNDGWHTWRVEAVESAPELCCYDWRGGRPANPGCDLDSRRGGYGSSSDATGGDVQLYVRMEDGAVVDIRALSASCPVTSTSPIIDLGQLDNAESVAWLENQIVAGSDLSSDAIAAVSVHEGDEAVRLLTDRARNAADEDIREESIFWMAQVRVSETADVLKDFIFDDDNADIREHAAFSYSQSNADDVAEVLIRQGRRDADPDVRTQAWFWLAQTEAVEAEDVILRAIREDADDDVREDAVFALSQLPEDRAVAALGQVLEDTDLDRDIREQALFWLVQSDTDEAFEYLDEILSAN